MVWFRRDQALRQATGKTLSEDENILRSTFA